MFTFGKKPKIEFQCLVEGVDRIMPITSAKDSMPTWVYSAREDFINSRQTHDYRFTKQSHIAKCPGIFSLMRKGWILKTWQDIVIETNGNLDSFSWSTPINQKATSVGVDYVDFHSSVNFRNYMQNWPKDTLNCIIKIQSPWVAKIPKGHYLLELPVPYADENRFTTLSGVFDCDHGPAPLNQQLQWHVTNGKTLIKAGTPLAHYLLLDKKDVDFINTVKQDKSDDFITRSLAVANRFNPNYKDLVKIFS
jgi:hypothetical protein